MKLGGENPAAPQGLKAAKKTADMWDSNYAAKGDPASRFAKSLEQQAFVRKNLFDPQYNKALGYALDSSAPEAEAQKATQQATNANALTRDEFMRMQGRSGARMDPEVVAENSRLQKLNEVTNIADAANMARGSTTDFQASQLGDLTGLGVNVARQALGLQSGAASAYQQRQNQLLQEQQTQKSMAAQATAANIGMGVSVVMSVASIAAAAAIA